MQVSGDARGDADARATGLRALLRAIGEGLSRDRMLAIERAPIAERDVLEAVQKAGYKTVSKTFRTIVNQALIANGKVFRKVSRGQYTAR